MAGKPYTGTVDSSLTATVSVLGIGVTYTLSAAVRRYVHRRGDDQGVLHGACSNARGIQSTITVTIDSGSTVTATLGSIAIDQTSTGTAVFTGIGKAAITGNRATIRPESDRRGHGKHYRQWRQSRPDAELPLTYSV